MGTRSKNDDYPKVQFRLTPAAQRRLKAECERIAALEGSHCPPGRILVNYIMNGGPPLPPCTDEPKQPEQPEHKLQAVARRAR